MEGSEDLVDLSTAAILFLRIVRQRSGAVGAYLNLFKKCSTRLSASRICSMLYA